MASTFGRRTFLEIEGDYASGSCTLKAGRLFQAGEAIVAFAARKVIHRPSKHSLQVGSNQHALLIPTFLRYVNHSCDPNVFFDTESRELRALRTIKPGQEVLCFYPATEWVLASAFHCRCGQAGCLKIIRGASRVDPELLVHHTLSTHIRAMLLEQDRRPVQPRLLAPFCGRRQRPVLAMRNPACKSASA